MWRFKVKLYSGEKTNSKANTKVNSNTKANLPASGGRKLKMSGCKLPMM
jgi:hypothetical protein